MIKFFFGLVKSVVFVCGLVFCAIFTVGFVEGFRAELARQAEVKSDLDTLIAEFIAIEPRTEWPTLMAEVDDESLVREFVEGAREAGANLSPAQRDVARLIIIPRIKETMARTVDRLCPNGNAVDVDPSRLMAAMEQDCDHFRDRYKPVMAALLQGSDATSATIL